MQISFRFLHLFLEVFKKLKLKIILLGKNGLPLELDYRLFLNLIVFSCGRSCQVVSVLALSYDDPSFNPADFYVSFVFEKNENK